MESLQGVSVGGPLPGRPERRPGGCRRHLRVSNRDNARIDRREIAAGESLEVELPADDKFFFYLQLPAGSRLRGLRLERLDRVRPS